MKNCTITFKIGETTRNIVVPEEEFYGAEGERSLPTWDFQARLGQLLARRKDEWNSLKQVIIQTLKDNSAISRAVTYSQLKDKQGLVPNVNFKYIQNTYPEIEFPDIDVPILLIDNLDAQSKYPVSGRVIDKKGKEIFVVRGDKDSLVQLKGYLEIREKVLSGEYKETLDQELSDALSQIAAKKGISPEETILQYLNNTKAERKSGKELINGASMYTWMTYISNAIKGTPIKVKYKHPLINEFNRRLTTNKYDQRVIAISELHGILKQLYPHLFTKQQEFIRLFGGRADIMVETLLETKNMTDEEIEFLQLLDDERNAYRERHDNDETEQWGMSTLFNAINQLTEPNENPISLRPLALNDGKFILEDKFPTLRSAYGYGYETVSAFTEEEERNGYHIYSQTKEVGDSTITYYYVTPYFINENLQARRFASLNDAQDWIDEHFANQKLKENSFWDLKGEYNDFGLEEKSTRTFETEKFIPEGTVFSMLDMPMDLRSQSMLDTEFLLLNKSLQEFYDYINTLDFSQATKDSIISKINTAEKATIFLSELNKRLNSKDEQGVKTYPRNDNDKVKAILNDIDTKQPTYYYVSKSFKVDDGKYRVHYIVTDEKATTEHRYNKRTPVIQFLNSIAKVMKEKFGVPVNIVDSQELTDMGMEDINLIKAFIKDGEVYINSDLARIEDAFHEYAHLFLGALKANPDFRDNYLAFVDKVLSTERGQETFNRKKKKFPNLSDFDIAEETVADLYGDFMEGNLPLDLSMLFSTNDDIKKIQDTIFDKKDRSKAIQDFDGSLESIWKRFNSDVTKTLSDNISFIKDGALQVQRQKDNWIKDQIREGNIKENCE